MAKDIKYIDDGTAINALWTDHIAISGDGVNWDVIPKAGMFAGKHAISLNSNAPNSYPERNKDSGFVIVVKRNDADTPLLKFNPENVVNQATWSTTGTATDIASGAQQALADIIGWLAS